MALEENAACRHVPDHVEWRPLVHEPSSLRIRMKLKIADPSTAVLVPGSGILNVMVSVMVQQVLSIAKATVSRALRTLVLKATQLLFAYRTGMQQCTLSA
eukprot:2381911-Amphidinium_carterae.1